MPLQVAGHEQPQLKREQLSGCKENEYLNVCEALDYSPLQMIRLMTKATTSSHNKHGHVTDPQCPPSYLRNLGR